MTKILKPLTLSKGRRLIEICSDFLVDAMDLKVIGQGLGSRETGVIDILAIDKDKLYITTVDTSDFSDALFRSILAYRWYKENRGLIEKLSTSLSGTDNLRALEPSLVVFSPSPPQGIYSALKELFSLPVYVFRFTLFGSETSPEIFAEEMDASLSTSKPTDFDTASIRKELGIEASNLTDEEIKEFLETFRG